MDGLDFIIEFFDTGSLADTLTVAGSKYVALPSPGDFPNLGIGPRYPTLQADSLPREKTPTGAATRGNP